jgi:DNA-binding NarL/FixJ family response regulator
MTKPYKILIADDHLIFLESISLLLNSIEEVVLVGAVSNGKEVLEKIKHEEIDILLCDYMMPQMNGLELTLKLREIKSEIKILMLTGIDDLQQIKQTIQAGVHGILSKNIRKDELRKAINAVCEGLSYYSQDIMQILAQNPFKENATKIEVLSPRELEILKLIAQSLTGIEIANKLFISTNTVESHRKNIFRKLEVNSSLALIKYAFEHKLI